LQYWSETSDLTDVLYEVHNIRNTYIISSWDWSDDGYNIVAETCT